MVNSRPTGEGKVEIHLNTLVPALPCLSFVVLGGKWWYMDIVCFF